MLLTTEWDLHDLLRELVERLLMDAQREHGSFGAFLELVSEEESVILWFGAEDRRGRGAKFEIVARHDPAADAIAIDVAADGEGVELYRLNAETIDPQSREWVGSMGAMRKDGLKRLFEGLVRSGDLDLFFYAVRTSAPADKSDEA